MAALLLEAADLLEQGRDPAPAGTTAGNAQ
jgi:hypothetical protein